MVTGLASPPFNYDPVSRILIAGENPKQALLTPDPLSTLFLGTPEQKKDVPLVALFDALKGNKARLPTAMGMPNFSRRRPT